MGVNAEFEEMVKKDKNFILTLIPRIDELELRILSDSLPKKEIDKYLKDLIRFIRKA